MQVRRELGFKFSSLSQSPYNIMGSGPSKQSRSKGQFGDFTVEHKSPLAMHSSSSPSSPPPYTAVATSPLAYPPFETDTRTTYSPLAPLYTMPSPPRVNEAYLRKPMRAESVEDALETLRKYDTIILMDDSSSMAGSLWTEVHHHSGSLTSSIEIYLLRQKRLWRRLPM